MKGALIPKDLSGFLNEALLRLEIGREDGTEGPDGAAKARRAAPVTQLFLFMRRLQPSSARHCRAAESLRCI